MQLELSREVIPTNAKAYLRKLAITLHPAGRSTAIGEKKHESIASRSLG